jgi:hypothetical protein
VTLQWNIKQLESADHGSSKYPDPQRLGMFEGKPLAAKLKGTRPAQTAVANLESQDGLAASFLMLLHMEYDHKSA